MFAGIPELFIILVVVFAAWHVVKAFNRLGAQTPPRAARPQARPQPQARPMIEAEDLVNCPICGTYIAASARHCGRAGCPQPR
ncbi:MAG TPA: hypothetical protein VMB84_16655 [Stellaceae bacterium]|nr:hypothetical protein [Stellaceae bacterium]